MYSRPVLIPTIGTNPNNAQYWLSGGWLSAFAPAVVHVRDRSSVSTVVWGVQMGANAVDAQVTAKPLHAKLRPRMTPPQLLPCLLPATH